MNHNCATLAEALLAPHEGMQKHLDRSFSTLREDVSQWYSQISALDPGLSRHEKIVREGNLKNLRKLQGHTAKTVSKSAASTANTILRRQQLETLTDSLP